MRIEAREQISKIHPEDRATISILSEDWHQGIIGILASRIKEKYFRPAMAFARDKDGKIRGSGRSIPEFHLRDALDLVAKRHPGLIVQFGGHAMAAGLTLQPDGFDVFTQAFENVAKEWLDPDTTGKNHRNRRFTGRRLFHSRFHWPAGYASLGTRFSCPGFLRRIHRYQPARPERKALASATRKKRQELHRHPVRQQCHTPAPRRLAYRLDANEFNGRTSVQLIVEHSERV